MRVLIAGGGTAGHVNPAVALAGALEGEVLFLGTERGVESRLVPDAGYEIRHIDVKGFDRSRPWSLLPVGVTALRAVAQAGGVMKDFSPDAVVGMGGYVSLPAVLAAARRRVPVVLHEQNAVLGLAHKVSKPFARRVAVSFEETLSEVGSKGVHTGNPVLSDLAGIDTATVRAEALDVFDLRADRKTLLVFGGSLGARTVNSAAAGLAARWGERTDVQILHITGSSAYEAVRSEVGDAPGSGLIYRVVEYVDRMSLAYAVADLALCRGGATTVAELCIVGLPSVVVPYPHHRDKQQERHGRALERAGAATVLPDAEANVTTVAELVDRILGDDEARSQMSAAAKELARPDAAARLAAVVIEVGS